MVELPRFLRGERVVLRTWKLADVDDVLAYAVDPEWGRYIPTPFPYTRSDAEVFVAQQRLNDGSQIASWAITLAGQEAIGSIELRREVPHRANLGYAIARSFWGQGLTTEAAHLVIDTAFTHWPDLHKIFAYCDERNVASERVLLKLGLAPEGRLRGHFRHRAEFIHALQFGILRPEWHNARSQAGIEPGLAAGHSA